MEEFTEGRYRDILTINLSKDNEVREWSEKWLVSPAQIREAYQKSKHNSVASIHEALVTLGYIA